MHPRLATKVNRVFESERNGKGESGNRNNRGPPKLKFWPHESRTEYAWLIVSASVTDYRFSVMAGLFMVLEAKGLPRRVLWEFLRMQVEGRREVSEDEKREFGWVMRKMCTGEVPFLINPFARGQWARRRRVDPEGREIVGEKGFSLPESSPVGVQIVPLEEGDGMEWLLYEKGLVVPMDRVAFQKVSALAKFGSWGKVREDVDLEDEKLRDVWQYVDLRVA